MRIYLNRLQDGTNNIDDVQPFWNIEMKLEKIVVDAHNATGQNGFVYLA